MQSFFFHSIIVGLLTYAKYGRGKKMRLEEGRIVEVKQAEIMRFIFWQCCWLLLYTTSLLQHYVFEANYCVMFVCFSLKQFIKDGRANILSVNAVAMSVVHAVVLYFLISVARALGSFTFIIAVWCWPAVSVIHVVRPCHGCSITLTCPNLWCLQETAKVFQPLFLARMLQYFSTVDDADGSSTLYCYLYALAAVGTLIVVSASYQPFEFFSYVVGMRMRAGSCALIYRKVWWTSKAWVLTCY